MSHDKGDVEEEEEEESDDEPEWVKQAYQSTIVNRSKSKLVEYEQYLDKIEKEYDQNVRKDQKLEDRRRMKKQKQQETDESFLPTDYHSDSDEVGNTENQNKAITKEIDQLMKKFENKDEVNYINECPIKIFYSSRTHSQLNQFSSQLRLTHFEASFEELNERTKYIPLGSRKQLCINEKVRSKAMIKV